MNVYPVQVRADRDASPPSRWLWLVKWLLLIPHYVVLAVLWIAFVVLTLVAYVAVLFTGRYPRGIFGFNVGVLRWSWRVGYYGYEVLGTDRYPPFTLAEVPDYPAGLHVQYPPRIPRWLPLVAWLFAIPHFLIVSAFTGAGTWQLYQNTNTTVSAPLGVVSIGILIAAVILLFTGRHPRGLYDLLVGVARWSLRVVAYVALLTHAYPPFRLDQGDHEPVPGPDGPPSPTATRSEPPAPVPPMLVKQPPPQPPAAPAPPANGAAVVGRVIALVAGVLVLLGGLGVGAGGTALLIVNSARTADGYVSSPMIDVASPTAAITAEGIQIQAGNAWTRDLGGFGDVRITASSPTGTALFLGIAAQSDVDHWLTGTAHDQLIDPYNGDNQPRYDRAPGAIRAVGPPSTQTFWLASATGSGTVVLDWKASNGRFAVVLTNANGSPGVTAAVRVATRVPNLAPLGIGLLGIASVFILVAIFLIYIGASGLGRRHAPPPPAPVAPVNQTGPPPPGPPTPTPVGTSPGVRG